MVNLLFGVSRHFLTPSLSRRRNFLIIYYIDCFSCMKSNKIKYLSLINLNLHSYDKLRYKDIKDNNLYIKYCFFERNMNSHCTWIDGVASSQNVDTSGEIVDLAGMDISSLVHSQFSYEHEMGSSNQQVKVPAQIVGKILQAHKIFSEKDCQNDRHLYYWNKCKLPFLYVMGRLFDDKKPSAVEVAALFKDDAAHPAERPMVGFSIEGSTLLTDSGVVKRSVARKLTVTLNPANKVCIAQMMPTDKPSEKDDLSSLFKGEMTLFNFEPTYAELMKHEIPTSQNETNEVLEKGENGDWSKEGYTVSHTAMPNGTHHLEAKDKSGAHVGAAEFHPIHSDSTKEHYLHPKQVYVEGAHKRKGLAFAMYDLAEKKSGLRVRHSRQQSPDGSAFARARKRTKLFGKSEDLLKSLTAGSGMAAPAQLEGGAALGKENLKKGEGWYKRADEAYKTWDKKEHFRGYMKKRMPHLAEGEVDAIGRMVALKKTMQAESKLSKMYSSYFQKGEVKKTSDIMMASEKTHVAPAGDIAAAASEHKHPHSHEPTTVHFGNTKPSHSHEEMTNPGFGHGQRAFDHAMHAHRAMDEGQHGLATRHRLANDMHARYGMGDHKNAQKIHTALMKDEL